MGGFKLDYDMSWTAVAAMAQRNQEMEIIERILGSSNATTNKALTDQVQININIGNEKYPKLLNNFEMEH